MRALSVIVLLTALQGPAAAACFEDLGQTGCTDQEVFPRAHLGQLSCENLWYVRNTIYDENGYCFSTAKAQAQFDNSDCKVKDAKFLNFNEYEQENIDNIVKVEKQNGCRP